MSKIGIGIIGAGYMGNTHAEAFSRIPEAKLVAVADISKEKARDLALKYGMESSSDY